MKFSRMASLVCLLCLFPLSVPVQAADSLKISSTIGPVDAGILPLLASSTCPVRTMTAGSARTTHKPNMNPAAYRSSGFIPIRALPSSLATFENEYSTPVKNMTIPI